ncbi:TraR/DksA C4-type zinc finger protein [Staphylospora marina]|uniref:TraR/DksA C4-type zinc finger protein n=1 Tax=Staphylospora marina TaxID=2490858 RepID=UPI0013DE1D85|nr:TraR/DksA C4-type zinc finger protein [Staphylospora marina]
MNQEQLNRLRRQLLEEQQEIERRLQRNDHYGMESAMNESVGELSGYDNHPADLGTEMFERGKDLALNEQDEHHLREIMDALRRMEKGTYGICQTCGAEIPFERLEAVPTAKYCVDHHPEQHVSARRPVEERVIRPGSHFLDESDAAFFDAEDSWQEVERYGTSNPPDFFRDAQSYNQLVIDAGEQRGYVDLVEGFTITGMDGRNEGLPEITHNEAFRRKDQEETMEEERRGEGFRGGS